MRNLTFWDVGGMDKIIHGNAACGRDRSTLRLFEAVALNDDLGDVEPQRQSRCLRRSSVAGVSS